MPALLRRRSRMNGSAVHHGPVVDTLLERGVAVHAINPKRLDRSRDRFGGAGAKDARRDARVAAAGLRTDRHLFRPVQVSNPAGLELRAWSRLAEEPRQERVRQQLWRYHPQLLALSDDVAAEGLLALWTSAPTPAKAARPRATTVARLLKRHRVRRLDAETAIGILRQPAVKVAAGVTEAAVLHRRSLIARLRLAKRERHRAARQPDELCAALSQAAAAKEGGSHGAAILASLPGIGAGTLATLLAGAAGPLGRRDHAALRTLSGVAPVTKRSGKSHLVGMRQAAQARLRQAVSHGARVAVQNDPESRSRYDAPRGRGHSYGRALRGVADRLLGIARRPAAAADAVRSQARCATGGRSIGLGHAIVARALKTVPSISPAKRVLQPSPPPFCRLARE
jgi:hypothetical protein